MATETQEIFEDEVDDTAEKAKEIGKEIGVVDDKNKEDVPDYVIQEEPDERIAKERESKPERPQLTNKEKRELRKRRISEKFNEKDAIIAAQQQQLEQLNRRMSEVDGRLSGINQAELQKAYNDTTAAFAQAERDHAAAFSEGDGARATQAMRVMYEAQRRIEQIETINQQIQQPTRQPAAPQVDTLVVTKATAWARRNSWYDASGKDADSEVAKAISGALANEGYDPKSDDFWDELDERLEKYIPERIAAHEEEESEAPVRARKRTAPPVGGGSNRGDIRGKKAISLPTSYINTLKANGIWDDPKRRNKVLAERDRILREAGQ